MKHTNGHGGKAEEARKMDLPRLARVGAWGEDHGRRKSPVVRKQLAALVARLKAANDARRGAA